MNYKEKQLKNLKEANELMSIILGKFSLANYVGSLREYKELVGIKLKLERVLKRAEAGYNWEKRRHDGPRTRSTK
jgi:hypothetical protein